MRTLREENIYLFKIEQMRFIRLCMKIHAANHYKAEYIYQYKCNPVYFYCEVAYSNE